jgi:hypothetical protein
MTRSLFIFLVLICLFSGSAFAEEKKEANQQPLTIEAINQNEARENVSSSLQELANLLMQGAKKKYNDCLKAFGSHDFCQCLKNKTPSSISFTDYVAVVITPKEELGYSKADEGTKGIIDNTLKAREACVATK